MFPHDYKVSTEGVSNFAHRIMVLKSEIEVLRDEFLMQEMLAGGPPGPFAGALDMAIAQLVHVAIAAEEVEEYRASEAKAA